MSIKALQLTSILSVTITFAAGFAHLLEAYHKMQLSKNEYYVVQQVYRGWALLGIIIFIALLATLLLAIQTRHQRQFTTNLLCFIFILLSLAVFFIGIYPVNQQTQNWEVLPDNWKSLRTRWETCHVISAVLYFTALLLIVVPWVYRKDIK